MINTNSTDKCGRMLKKENPEVNIELSKIYVRQDKLMYSDLNLIYPRSFFDIN